MSISRRHANDENSPPAEEENNFEDFNSKLHMIEFYIVTENPRLEKLISDYNGSTVDLSCQKLTNPDMAIIIKHAILKKKCQILNLWGNRFTFECLPILSTILNGNQTLNELDLSHNRLSDRGVQIISEALALDTCAIKELDLSSNDVTDQGAQYLAHMLRKNRQLEYLVLNKNEITNDGFLILANALVRDNQTLKQLKLESNPLITQPGVIDVLKLLRHNSTLDDIDVKDCSIQEKHFDMLKQMSFTTGFDIIVTNKYQ